MYVNNYISKIVLFISSLLCIYLLQITIRLLRFLTTNVMAKNVSFISSHNMVFPPINISGIIQLFNWLLFYPDSSKYSEEKHYSSQRPAHYFKAAKKPLYFNNFKIFRLSYKKRISANTEIFILI